MQQLKWDSMIPQAAGSAGGNPLRLLDGSDIDRQVGGDVNEQLATSKSVSQMSLNEILASSEYP